MRLEILFPSDTKRMSISPRIVTNTSRLHSRTAGVSLIELLIVVACVAILAALIFPVTRSVKDGANMAKSLANLRQIGQAARLYIGENNGFLPRADGRNEDAGQDWPTGMRPYGGGVSVPEPVRAQNRIFINPAGWSTEFAPGSEFIYSYCMNGNLQNMPPPAPGEPIAPIFPIHVTTVLKPMQTVMFADTAVAGRAMNYQHVAYRCLKNTKATMVFVDGHCEARGKNELTFDANFRNPPL